MSLLLLAPRQRAVTARDASWATDETLSTSGITFHDVTVQWCLIAENLIWSVHQRVLTVTARSPQSPKQNAAGVSYTM